MTVIKGLFLQKDFGTKAAVEYGQKKKKEGKSFGDDRDLYRADYFYLYIIRENGAVKR